MPKPVRSTIYTYQIGNPQTINRTYNFVNNVDGGLGPVYFWNNYLSPFRRPPTPTPNPPISNTIVALLDFSNTGDERIKKTLEYYFDNVPSFTKFLIIDTGSTVDGTLALLNDYYSKGFRYFIGFTISNNLINPDGSPNKIMQWFNDYPDTTPISPDSGSSFLSFQKSLYRLSPVATALIELYTTIILGNKDVIYFIYDSTFPQNDELLLFIQIISERTGKTPLYYPIDGNENITIETINGIMTQIYDDPNGNPTNSSIIVSMITGTNKFYNTFDSTTPNPGKNFFELNVQPELTSTQAITYFNTILFIPDIANLCSSPLWRQGYESLGQNNYNSRTLNTMIMAYNLESNGYIDQLGSHNNTLVFNEVTRDNDTASVSYSLLINGVFTPKIIGFQNSLNEIYIGTL